MDSQLVNDILLSVKSLTENSRLDWNSRAPFFTRIKVDNAVYKIILTDEAKFQVMFDKELMGTIQTQDSEELLTTIQQQKSFSPLLKLRDTLQEMQQEEPEYDAWVQPQGAHDAYPINARVTHNGKSWINEIPNNVWEPGVYGWREL
jgi:hypothetical protein